MSDYLEDWSKAEYQCPKCEGTEGMWQEIEVSGWRSVKVDYLESEGIPVFTPVGGNYDRDVDWTTVSATGPLGCGQCGWEGYEKDLKLVAPPRKGWDGKPLDKPMPGQLDLLP